MPFKWILIVVCIFWSIVSYPKVWVTIHVHDLTNTVLVLQHITYLLDVNEGGNLMNELGENRAPFLSIPFLLSDVSYLSRLSGGARPFLFF